MRLQPWLHILLAFVSFSFFGCGNKNSCEAPRLDLNKVKRLKRSLHSTGPVAALVLPNPIEATRNARASLTSLATINALEPQRLPGLLDPKKLENAFLKIRGSALNDDASKLAKPDAKGNFVFSPDNQHYAEVMAYHSLESMIRYVEALGFSIEKSRPLYVMVRAKTSNSSEVNAVYNHNYLNPKIPRTIHLYGEGAYAPGVDRDMYWHEIGHLVNESISREVGIDFAGDNSAVFTQGAALHECLADYINESVSDKSHVGTWLARNFSDIPPGEPLRSAVDRGNDRLTYDEVALNDGRGKNPERYRMAEWCTRVLWEIRSHLVKADQENGSILSDELVFSALSLLSRDTSVREFRQKLVEADEKLFCGENRGAIDNAFNGRGFPESFPGLSQPLQVKATPVRNGQELTFVLSVKNPNDEVARNVRVELESPDGKFFPITYMQGYGDLPAGASLKVGGSNTLGAAFSVSAELESSTAGKKVPYRLIIRTENGPENIIEGEVAS